MAQHDQQPYDPRADVARNAPPPSYAPPQHTQPYPQPQYGPQQYAQPQYVQNFSTVVMLNQKSAGVAYLLWFFLGGLGIHKFYLNQTGLGILYICLSVFGWATTFILIGFIPLGILWLMLFIDLFLIPSRTRTVNVLTASGTFR